MQDSPASRLLPAMMPVLLEHLGKPEKLALVCLGCEHPGHPVHFEIFRADAASSRFVPSGERQVFDPARWKILLNGNAPSQVEAAQLPLDWHDHATRHNWLLLPLSVFSAPFGFLLLPASANGQTLQEQHFQLYGLMLDTLLSDLDACFSDEILLAIEEPRTLCLRFHEALLPWLAPYSQALFDETEVKVPEPYFALWEVPHAATRFTISAAEHTFHLEYTFPSGQQFVGRPAVWALLRRYFEQILYKRWERLKAPMPDRKNLEEKLDQVTSLLEGLRTDVSRIPYNLIYSHRDARPPDDFCFYLPEGKTDWVIYFKGVQAVFDQKAASDQGLESIRILLQNPGKHFDPIKLREKNPYGRSKGQLQMADKYLDEQNFKELHDALQQLINEGSSSKFKANTSVFYQSEHWKYRYALANELLKFRKNIPFYTAQYNKAKESLTALNVVIDENFVNPYKAVTAPQQPSGDVKKSKDTLRAGIKKTLDALERNIELYDYLTATLVITSRDKFTPFIYEPALYPGPDRSLMNAPFWETGASIW